MEMSIGASQSKKVGSCYWLEARLNNYQLAAWSDRGFHLEHNFLENNFEKKPLWTSRNISKLSSAAVYVYSAELLRPVSRAHL
jgi:hypothetical protein